MGTGFAVFIIAEFGSRSGGCFHHHLMPVAHQDCDGFGREGDAVFLKRNFLRQANQQAVLVGFDNYRSLLRVQGRLLG